MLQKSSEMERFSRFMPLCQRPFVHVLASDNPVAGLDLALLSPLKCQVPIRIDRVDVLEVLPLDAHHIPLPRALQLLIDLIAHSPLPLRGKV